MLPLTPLFIISQILMFISFGITLVAFQLKKPSIFRIFFVVSSIFTAAHFILLGAYTAAIIVLISGSRWLASLFTKQKIFIAIFMVLAVVAAILTWDSWISLLPLAASLLGTLASFNTKEAHTRKILLGATSLWILHNTLVFTPVGIFAEGVFLVSNTVGYLRNWRKKT